VGAQLIGVGIDVVDVDRFRAVLARTPGILARVFTDGERAYAERHRDPAPRLAARFAAKEATMKAMQVGLGAFAFRDVEIVRLESQAPELQLEGRAAELASALGVRRWHVSLTHGRLVAQAVVIAL
jgi:holo-[acyl-carrier protein] synthase